MEIYEKLKEIIVKELGVTPEQVTMEARFVDDLGADSIGVMELIMEMEKAFDLEVPDEDVEKLRTVGDAVKYLEEKLKK